MTDTKQTAKDILEDYANCYSQVDLEQLVNVLDNIKAEAVKEFEERAIKNICEKVYAPTPVQSCIVEKCNQVIIETAKEMVGEG